MKKYEGLDVQLFSRPVVERLLAGNFLVESDVVQIEAARLASGLLLDGVELRLACLLADEIDQVAAILGECHDAASLEGQDRKVYLWLRLTRVRANWSQLVDPQFYVEELLDTFDHEDAYAEMRFFLPLPRRELTPRKYLMRVDAVLADRQLELNES